MRDIHKQGIKGFLMFLAMGMLVFGIFYGAYHGPWDKSLRNETARIKKLYEKRSNERLKLAAVQEDRIILALDQPVRFGKNKYVFKGLKGDRIHIAVYILDLDPETAYRHMVPLEEAGKGLRLGGQSFKVITCRSTMLILGYKDQKRSSQGRPPVSP